MDEMNDDVRLICAKCGACAGHPEDREGQHCRHCGEREKIVQERNASGVWVTPNVLNDVSEGSEAE